MTRPDVVDLSYAQAFWTLLDKGEYYGLLSTIHRVMKDAGLNVRRDGTRQGVKRHKPTSFEATGPNQVWTWDITYLRDARYKGKFFYAYAIVDVFSRLAVHAKVYDADNAEYARTFLNEAFHKHGIRPRSLVVHSDNGASMRRPMKRRHYSRSGASSAPTVGHVSATTILTRSRSSDR